MDPSRLDIDVEPSPTRWLRGPDRGSPEEIREHWVEEAVKVYLEAFGVRRTRKGARTEAYVRRVFEAFSRWPTDAPLRYLRMRHPTDDPMPVGVEFYDDEEVADRDRYSEVSFHAQLLTPEPEVVGAVVGEPSVEVVAAAPGWERLFYSSRDGEGVVLSHMVYVCWFHEAELMVAFRLMGVEPPAAVEVIEDMDHLAASIRVRITG